MIPIFPLNSVLLPKGRIPLQLFESRYIDMIADCMKSQTGFVIALIERGKEVESNVDFYKAGTRVFIQDFNQLANGLLGITVEGIEKVHIYPKEKTKAGLHLGEYLPLETEPKVVLPDGYLHLVELLERLMMYPAVKDLHMAVDWHDARDIGWRLTELLPVPAIEKQRFLEMNDPLFRLDQITDVLALLEG